MVKREALAVLDECYAFAREERGCARRLPAAVLGELRAARGILPLLRVEFLFYRCH